MINVEYFVNKSGGFKKFADVNSIYILHPNGESVRYENKRNIFESQPKSEVKVYPGSIIFVPRKLDESTSRRLATQAYVSILGNLGIALASLSSINNNYSIIIIADHGNSDVMKNNDGSPNTAHTTNPVPIIVIDSKTDKVNDGILADIAPTILNIMDIDIPEKMSGKILI